MTSRTETVARVLVVDDEPVVRRTMARALMAEGLAVDTAEGGAAALDLLRTRPVDAVLVDRAMPDLDGLAVLTRVRRDHPDIEVVVMVPAEDAPSAASALGAGAYEVVVKPIDSPEAVARVLSRAAERRRLREQVRALEQRMLEQEPLGEIIAASPRMLELDRRASTAASTSSPVLILGEPGTGKELFARVLHRRSNRARRPLHVLRLQGLPEDLAGAELEGALELSEGSTLLLDDVDALDAVAQATLVRALGADQPRLDVRILATAPPSLRDRVKQGTFRQDLFYRLAVILLEIPPLRRRRDDIPVLAFHFLSWSAKRAGKGIRRISPEALHRLREHDWPGNVRELATAVEHATAMTRGELILPADLPINQDPTLSDDDGELARAKTIAEGATFELPYPDAKARAVAAFDRTYVDRLMMRSGGNISEAARLAGMDRSNFKRLWKKARRR